MTKKISKIPSRIENAQVDELGNPIEVAGAVDIIDDVKRKTQDMYNRSKTILSYDLVNKRVIEVE